MIRCLAIDDSPLALDLLEDYISRIPELRLIARCQSAAEAMGFLGDGKIELIFLDIQMPDISGVDLFRSLEKKPKVIFITAHPGYAIEGFELNASDYLLKPISFERFSKAVERTIQQIRLEGAQGLEEQPLFIKSGYETVRISSSDILYIEALKDYVQLFTREKKILTLMSMKDILALLPEGKFIRVHRSFIIPLEKISGVSGRKLKIGNKEIPVGEIYRKEVQNILRARRIIR